MIVHTGTHLLRACVPRAVEKIRENDASGGASVQRRSLTGIAG